MMLGSVLYAYVLGAICQLVAAMNKSSLEYRETMEEVHHTKLRTSNRASNREFILYFKSHLNRSKDIAIFQA